MPLDVSVVVPVYNPGANLDPCVRSLVAQSMPQDRYEIVLVDDGSTDGTADLLDEWQERHPSLVRVLHEPNSGWPGRPRNVGVAAARGDYVQFVDNDDLLLPRALERMVEAARACDADIVLGKMSSDFRGINHDVYRENRLGVTLADFPLVESLTPHKMFRRAFLGAHDIRFAEGPLHLEDQLFCMTAYTRARSVAVVADEHCYFYKRRSGFGRNAGDIPADPDDYYRDLERVFDVIDVHVGPDRRARLYERFLRVEMLGRLRDRQMLDYADDYRRHLFRRVRRLAEDRIPRAVDRLLPYFPARQAELLRARDLDGMLALAHDITAVRVTARVEAPRWVDGELRLDVAAALDSPLPVRADADVVVVARDTSATWFVGDPMRFDARSGLRTTVMVDPEHALFGRPLTPGLWDLRLRVRIGGITRTTRLDVDEAAALHTCLYDGPPQTVAPYVTAAGGLALDVDEWAHSLTEQVARDAVPEPAGWQVPTVVAARQLRRQVDVLADGVRVPASLAADGDGARITGAGAVPGDVWLRVGAPGSAAPVRLSASG